MTTEKQPIDLDEIVASAEAVRNDVNTIGLRWASMAALLKIERENATALQSRVTELEGENAAKDRRIAELQQQPATRWLDFPQDGTFASPSVYSPEPTRWCIRRIGGDAFVPIEPAQHWKTEAERLESESARLRSELEKQTARADELARACATRDEMRANDEREIAELKRKLAECPTKHRHKGTTRPNHSDWYFAKGHGKTIADCAPRMAFWDDPANRWQEVPTGWECEWWAEINPVSDDPQPKAETVHVPDRYDITDDWGDLDLDKLENAIDAVNRRVHAIESQMTGGGK